MTKPDKLADADKASLDAILAASPELAAVTANVRAFAVIMNEKRGRKLLEPWMAAAAATGEPALKSFVTGLRADQEAVTNGLSLPWSSGAVEGHVNRINARRATGLVYRFRIANYVGVAALPGGLRRTHRSTVRGDRIRRP
jgi:transposase